jgi:hypothetical protein
MTHTTAVLMFTAPKPQTSLLLLVEVCEVTPKALFLAELISNDQFGNETSGDKLGFLSSEFEKKAQGLEGGGDVRILEKSTRG